MKYVTVLLGRGQLGRSSSCFATTSDVAEESSLGQTELLLAPNVGECCGESPGGATRDYALPPEPVSVPLLFYLRTNLNRRKEMEH